MNEPNVQEELAELGKLVEWHDAVKAQNDKAEKQQRFVMPNRRDKRRAKKRKAQG